MSIDILKREHMAAAEVRWERACERVARLLNYDRCRDYGEQFAAPTYVHEDAAVREVTRCMLTMNQQSLWAAMGGLERTFEVKLGGYTTRAHFPENPCDLMEFTAWFVGHELLDDGCPGVGYYRRCSVQENMGGLHFVRCEKDHPGAEPYFVRDSDDPQVEGVCVKAALEILEFHEAQRAERARKIREHRATQGDQSFWTEEHVKAYLPSPEQEALSALCDALTRK